MPENKLSSRAQVLNFLKQNGEATAQQIAEHLGISSVAVRKHVASLEADGVVTSETRRVPRGRPHVIYRLTPTGERLFPRSYDQFAVDLLEDLAVLSGNDQVQRLFEMRNRRLAQTYQIRLQNKPIDEKVRELARARDEDGYMATVDERDGELILAEHNCPIQDVAERFPNACRCEQQLFSEILNRKVEREASLLDGDKACRYKIRT